MKTRPLVFTAAISLLLASGAANAQTARFACGGSPPAPPPTITPTFSKTSADRTNLGFECMMWQNFIYLNWPATKGQRGMPDAKAKFGGPGATVWETYKTIPQTFLPDAKDPGPWNAAQLTATLARPLAMRVSQGEVRSLTATSKISRPVVANVALRAASNPVALNEIIQAGGGTLYDLNGLPVYYEVAMNRDQYQYIQQNKLYNAVEQLAFATNNVISLPIEPGQYGTMGALELKAAWKVLSAGEAKSNRFHTTQALLPGNKQPVTVGLVGFHIFMSGFGGQGVWATFAQIDNAPVQGGPTTGKYNFYNPNCPPAQCPVNVENANPGQVIQITPDESSSPQLNTYMQNLIKTYNPKTPWQFYKIVNIQWPVQPVPLSTLKAPADAPLPDGSPNSQTVVNPVLETFQQLPGTGCLACHTGATVAAVGKDVKNYATSYSFMFGHATAPPK